MIYPKYLSFLEGYYQMQYVQLQSRLCPNELAGSLLASDPTSGRDFGYLLIFPLFLHFYSPNNLHNIKKRDVSCL